MPYPRQVYLDNELEEELKTYLYSELVRYYADTNVHTQDILQWQKDYWAKPTNKITNFPYRNASTIVIPITAIAVEAVHARTETQLFGQSQLVVSRSLSDEWDIAQKPVEDFMNYELLNSMKIKNKAAYCFLDAEKFGTMIGSVDYCRMERRGIRIVNGQEEEFSVVYKDGPEFDPIPETNFLLPYWAKDPQTADWVGLEYSESPYYVEQLETTSFFRPGTILPYEKGDGDRPRGKLAPYVDNYYMSQPLLGQDGKKFEMNQMELENTKFQFGKRLDWIKFMLAWPVDKTGIKKEIIVHFHLESQTIMSIRYNYFSDLRRNFRIGVYFPIEHRWRGIGICKMNEQFQRSITVRHRQNIDNATLANIRMFKISKLSGYGNDEPIFPGKMWFLDSMDQLDTVQLGEVYPSGYNVEQSDVVFSQQRTGVNEVTLGMPQVGTPGTATSDLARIQEGKMKFDLWYSRCREFMDDIVMDTADVVQQFGPRNLEYYNTTSNGNLVKSFFQLPSSYIRDGLILQLKTSSQVHNKILDRQNWQQLAAFFDQYYRGLAELALPLGNPQLLQTIFTKGLSSATEAMRQILETYDVRNIDRLIVKELDQVIQQGPTNDIIGTLPGTTPNNGTTSPNGSSGMDIISQILGNINGGGQNTPRRIESGRISRE